MQDIFHFRSQDIGNVGFQIIKKVHGRYKKMIAVVALQTFEQRR